MTGRPGTCALGRRMAVYQPRRTRPWDPEIDEGSPALALMLALEKERELGKGAPSVREPRITRPISPGFGPAGGERAPHESDEMAASRALASHDLAHDLRPARSMTPRGQDRRPRGARFPPSANEVKGPGAVRCLGEALLRFVAVATGQASTSGGTTYSGPASLERVPNYLPGRWNGLTEGETLTFGRPRHAGRRRCCEPARTERAKVADAIPLTLAHERGAGAHALPPRGWRAGCRGLAAADGRRVRRGGGGGLTEDGRIRVTRKGCEVGGRRTARGPIRLGLPG